VRGNNNSVSEQMVIKQLETYVDEQRTDIMYIYLAYSNASRNTSLQQLGMTH